MWILKVTLKKDTRVNSGWDTKDNTGTLIDNARDDTRKDNVDYTIGST